MYNVKLINLSMLYKYIKPINSKYIINFTYFTKIIKSDNVSHLTNLHNIIELKTITYFVNLTISYTTMYTKVNFRL